ncbi:MAG TPA: MBL fold metallo-hydrolase [Candidatus Acidoferrales bacterium]
MARENIRKWKIGDVEVVRIVEVLHEDPFEVLLPGATPEVAKQYDWLFPHFATPAGHMKIWFQAFVLRSGKEKIMIDTCIGNDRQREFPIFCNMQSSFIEDLTDAGYAPESVAKVLCTHMHFDHVGWNTRKVNGRWVPTFPNARYLFGRKEYEHWKMLERTGGYHDVTHLSDSIDPITDAGLADFIEPTHRLTDEVTLVSTPGHTPGHVSVLISSNGQEGFITGDMLHHPIQLAEIERPGNFDMDKEQGIKTRKAMFERLADKNILIIGSHFSDPTAGYIIRDKKNWRFKVQ